MMNTRWFRFEPNRGWGEVLLAGVPPLLVSGAALVWPLVSSWLPERALVCSFRWLTGWSCPFCGYTRALAAMSSGNMAAAWQQCPGGCVLFFALLVVFLYAATCLVLGLSGRWRYPRITGAGWTGVAVVFGAMVAANWVYRLILGL